MLVFYKKYNNSTLATVLSFIGSGITTLCAGLGVMSIISGEAVWDEVLCYAILALIGVGMSLWAKRIYENKVLKTIKKNVAEKNMENQIRTSTELAVAIYKNAPNKPVQKYITALNPTAGEIINQIKEEKNKK